MANQEAKNEYVKNDKIVQTTLFDLIKIGSTSTYRGTGHEIIKKLSKRLTKDDLKYIFFYLREEVWLIENDFFNVALINMITMIENCLRNEYYSRVKNEKLSKKEIEELGMGRLRIKLEPYISVEANRTLLELNKLRNVFIHKNMEVGKKYVLATKRFVGDESHLGGGSLMNRETTRVLVNSFSDSFVQEVFWISLFLVKDLYPDIKKIDASTFDTTVQWAMYPRCPWTAHRKKPDSDSA